MYIHVYTCICTCTLYMCTMSCTCIHVNERCMYCTCVGGVNDSEQQRVLHCHHGGVWLQLSAGQLRAVPGQREGDQGRPSLSPLILHSLFCSLSLTHIYHYLQCVWICVCYIHYSVHVHLYIIVHLHTCNFVSPTCSPYNCVCTIHVCTCVHVCIYTCKIFVLCVSVCVLGQAPPVCEWSGRDKLLAGHLCLGHAQCSDTSYPHSHLVCLLPSGWIYWLCPRSNISHLGNA